MCRGLWRKCTQAHVCWEVTHVTPSKGHAEQTLELPVLMVAAAHFLPFSIFSSAVTILPSITTPLPSRNAMRDRPSQFLNVSTTSGCCGAKVHSAISFDLSECGSSIFLPPVSLPIFHTILDTRHADRPHRTKPIGE